MTISMSRRMVGRSSRAFTLVELLISIAILAVILLLLVSVTAQTQGIWKKTTSKIEQFQGARTAFATMTQRIAEATLNTYTGYSDGTAGDTFYNTASFQPASFVRLSELRFLSMPVASPTPAFLGTAAHPTHGIFFFAPLGYTQNPKTSAAGNLEETLNLTGYYIEFNPDTAYAGAIPSFVSSASGYRTRYRYHLMELMEPTENVSIYKYTTVSGSTQCMQSAVSDALALTPSPVHVLADNVIALIVLPQLSVDQKYPDGTSVPTTALAPLYTYDSSTTGAAATASAIDQGLLDSNNQLPPIVQVTTVAIDEASAIRLQAQFGTSAPNFGITSGSLFQSAANYQADLDQLQANLLQASFSDKGTNYTPKVTLPGKMNYRIFSTNISVKGARWSTLQTN